MMVNVIHNYVRKTRGGGRVPLVVMGDEHLINAIIYDLGRIELVRNGSPEEQEIFDFNRVLAEIATMAYEVSRRWGEGRWIKDNLEDGE